jgi:hypothetical protein
VRDHQGLRPTSGTAVASVFLQARSVLINPTRCQDLLGAWDWRPNLAFRNGRNGRDPSVRRRFGPHRLEQLADHPTIKNCAMIADAIRVSRTEMTSSWIRVADRVRPLSPRRRQDGAPSQSRSTRNMSMSQCGGGKNGRVKARHADTGLTFVEEAARRTGPINLVHSPNASRDESPVATPTRVRKRIRAA